MIKSRLTVFVSCLFVLSFLLAPSPARTAKTQGGTTTGNVLVYSTKGKLSLFVRDGITGYGVKSEIVFSSSEGSYLLSTNEGGILEFVVESGRCDLTINTPGYKQMKTFFSITPNEEVKTNIWLDRESNHDVPETENESTAVVQGYVVDGDTGKPIEEVDVYLSIIDKHIKTNRDGYFRIESERVSRLEGNQDDSQRRVKIELAKESFSDYAIENFLLVKGVVTLRITLEKGQDKVTENYFQGILDKQNENTDLNEQHGNNQEQNSFDNEKKGSFLSLQSCPVLPTTIRVGTGCPTSGGRPVCTQVCTGTVQTMSLESYVQSGLDNEWISSWLPASLQAGAVAYRTYGAYYVINQPLQNPNYDIRSDTCNQAWVSGTASSCINAANATVGEVIVNSSNVIVKSEYSAENNDNNNPYSTCGNCFSGGNGWPCISDNVCCGTTFSGHGRGMCQWGSSRWATQGQTYTWILDHYYNPGNYFRCGSTGVTPPPNDNCSNAILLTSNTACSYTSGTVLNATASGLSKPSCDGSSSPNMYDVWYRFTATTSSQIVTVDPSTAIGDPVVSVYSSCSGSPIGCSDVGPGVTENLSLSGLTVGNTYYVRIYDYGSVEPTGSNADFQICITGTPNPGLPDLTITAGTQFVTPTPVAAGSSVTAGCSEDNSGTGTAGANVVSLYLSTDAVLTPGSSGDTYLGFIQFPSVAANSNSPVYSNNIQIPSGTAPGTYYFFFWADGGQVVNEISENNNFATRQLIVTPSVDATGPNLSIDSHNNGQTVSNSTINLFGTASDSGRGNNGISSVTVNGAGASGGTASGSGTANWNRTLTLNQGANNITVVARDNSASQNSTTQSITVNYQPAQNYTIAVSGSPSGGGTVGGGGTFAAGSSRTVTATANTGYSFTNWTENGSVVSSSASYNFILNSNRTLVANFTTINYTIAVSASPPAGGTVSGGGTFPAGSSRTVTATANSGYTFINWTENGSVVSSSSSYTFTLNSNRNLVANFTANPVNYTITASASPSAGGTVTGGGTFPAGSSRTVTATANGGYTFVNWTQNGSVVSSSASYTFTLNANRTLVATFTTAPPPIQPDLIVTVLTAPTSGSIGGQITVSVTVVNQGSANAGAFRLGFYFSTDNIITTGDTFTEYGCVYPGGLAAGASTICSGPVGVPSSLSPGTYYFGAIGDDLGAVAESNETNNARSADTGPVILSDTTQGTCASPYNLTAGQVFNGNTSGGQSSFGFYNCVGWDESGPERVHTITLNSPVTLTLTLSNLLVDLDIFILSSCSPNSCLAFGDNSASANLGPGTYYILVDGYLGAVGTYTLTVSGGQRFTDVPLTHPYYAYIERIAQLGITVGCTPTTYCPDSLVTRAEMAVFIERTLGVFTPPTPGSQRFTDVATNHWAYAFIGDFATRGITVGCTPTTYCPNDSVTREQMAVFMERAVGRPNPPVPSSQRFVDVPTNQWSYAFVESFVANGLGEGIMAIIQRDCNADGLHFCPGRPLTRGEMAAWLVVAFNL